MAIVTVSATTVPTVTYLTLSELENYKKQFQSFWLPFMEQFVPATTIWVAGERWCNEPCPIINVCDYDFEYVNGQITVQELSDNNFGETPTGRTNNGFINQLPTGNTTTTSGPGQSTATNPTTIPNISQVVDLGATTSTPVLRTVAETSVDILSYRNRFTELTTERIVL